MAASVVGGAAGAFATNGGTTGNLTLAPHASASGVSNLLLFAVHVYRGGATWNLPSGWANKYNVVAGTNTRIRIDYIQLPGSTPAADYTWTTGGTSGLRAGFIIAVSGANLVSDPFEASNSATSDEDIDFTLSVADVVTAGINTLFFYGMVGDSTITAFNVASGTDPTFTNTGQDETTDGTDGFVSVDHGTKSGTGGTGARTKTVTTDALTPDLSAIMFCLFNRQDITPTGIASTTAFGTAVVGRGAVNIAPTGIASTTALGTAVVTRGAVTIAPTGIASTTTFGTAVISSGAVNIAPTGIASTTSFGTAVVGRGTVNIAPTGIDHTNAFGSALITTGAFNIAPTGITSTNAFGTPSLSLNIAPTGIANTNAFGSATITTGTVDISPTGIPHTNEFGSTTVSQGFLIQPASIPHTNAFGTATLTTSAVDISPTGIPHTNAFGTASLSLNIAPTGIPHTNTFGTPSLSFNIAPTGIPHTNAFGGAVVLPGAVFILPGGIADTNAFGTATVALDTGQAILPSGIAHTNTFGDHTITVGAVAILPLGIPHTNVFGNATVSSVGAQLIECEGIPHTNAFGCHLVSGGALPLTMKKRVYDELHHQACLGAFISVTFTKEGDVLNQGQYVLPRSIEINEISIIGREDRRHGREYQAERDRWLWEMILCFDQQVIAELFEERIVRNPPCLHRLTNDPQERQARLLMVDCQPLHPPRGNSSNGSILRYRFEASLSPK